MKNPVLRSKAKSPLLTVSQTNDFLNDIDIACKTVNSLEIKKVLEKHNLLNYSETDEFLSQAVEILDFWKSNSKRIAIAEVTTHDSKCIACSFGKKVKVYQVHYKELKSEFLPERTFYLREFALNLEIENNRLMDFGWCNAFLNKEEIDRLEA